MKQAEDCGKPKMIPKGEDDRFKVEEREEREGKIYLLLSILCLANLYTH